MSTGGQSRVSKAAVAWETTFVGVSPTCPRARSSRNGGRRWRQAKEARLAAEDSARQAAEKPAAAVHSLLARGLSTRDVAELLEISHQRVAQVAKKTE